jgi:hypothetical protein
MAETWLSYADIAKALGTSPEAARQKGYSWPVAAAARQ